MSEQKPNAMADDRTRIERALEHIGEQLRSVVLELRVGKIPDSLAAIHDEQQAQTGLLTDLRGAIDDLAETLRPKPLNPGEYVLPRSDDTPEPDRPVWTLKMLREHLCHEQMFTTGPCSDVLQGAINAIDWHRPIGNDGKHGERHTATCGCDITPEPESVTVTLPRDVVERLIKSANEVAGTYRMAGNVVDAGLREGAAVELEWAYHDALEQS